MSNIIKEDAKNGLTLEETDSPIHMTLPGTAPARFEAFFQFNDDQPIKFGISRGSIRIELNEGETEWRDGMGKKFKIFLKKKT